MKKGRFLWSAHRITERQKAGKARSIKGKQLKNSRSTASRPPVAHPSSPSADRLFYFPRLLWPPGESFRPGAFACFAPAEQPRPRGIAAAVKALISFKRYCKAPESRGILELFQPIDSGSGFTSAPFGAVCGAAFGACTAPPPPDGFWPPHRGAGESSNTERPDCRCRSRRRFRTSSSRNTGHSRPAGFGYSRACRRSR